MDATPAAPVAQRFPLAAVERGERLFPKWRSAVHDKSSLALLSPPNQAGHLGHKVVKQLGFALVGALSMAFSAPAAAQALAPVGYEFVEAVKKSDANKVLQILASNPPGIVNTKDGEGKPSVKR